MEYGPPETDGGEPSTVVEFDPATESATETVRRAVETRSESPPETFETLEDVINGQALDALVRSVATRSDGTNAEITLRYRGYTVTVHAYGTVELAPAKD